MLEPLGPVCDVVACGRPSAGSYLDAVRARSVQFAVCDEHLSRLRAGQRPEVLTRDGSPALLFPAAMGAD